MSRIQEISPSTVHASGSQHGITALGPGTPFAPGAAMQFLIPRMERLARRAVSPESSPGDSATLVRRDPLFSVARGFCMALASIPVAVSVLAWSAEVAASAAQVEPAEPPASSDAAEAPSSAPVPVDSAAGEQDAEAPGTSTPMTEPEAAPPVVPPAEPAPEVSAPVPAASPTPPAEPPQAEPPQAKPLAAFLSGAPGEGITLQAERISLNIRSRVQIRYQLDIADGGEDLELQQSVGIGTARFWFSGHILRPELTYMIQLAVAARDFRDGSRSPIYDAYVDWKVHRDFSIRAGQFFVPFDRLRTVREWALQLASRPVPVGELTLDRDVGVVFYSNKFLSDKSPFAWRLGVFGGGGNNLATSKEPGALVLGRFELRPLGAIDDDVEGDLERRAKPALALGVGGAANFNTDRLRSTTGPTFTGGTTDYYHAAADLVFKVRGFALQGEYLFKKASDDTIESIQEDGTPLTEYTRSGHGWIAQASYVFNPPIEIVGRLSGLYALDDTDPELVSEADDYGQEIAAGLNYYLNGHKFKFQVDWIARVPHDFDFSVANHVIHAQLDVTF